MSKPKALSRDMFKSLINSVKTSPVPAPISNTVVTVLSSNDLIDSTLYADLFWPGFFLIGFKFFEERKFFILACCSSILSYAHASDILSSSTRSIWSI